MVVAGPGEESQFKPLIDAIPAEACVLVTNQPDLLVVAAMLARCDLFIGNDSGLMHIAAATGLPTMALFGPTNPNHFGPWGEKSCVLEAPLVSGQRAITGLSVESVAMAVHEMLSKFNPH